MGQAELKTSVPVANLFLATDNPRHEEVDDEKEAIDRLCRSEDIEELAKDIVRHGTSPAERLIVYPSNDDVGLNEINDKTTFIVAEGNRRLCALKLLRDPNLAPANIREAMSSLSDAWEPEKLIDVVVILDADRRRHWMKRIHDGVQGGKGRKPWNAEQKTRYSGTRRNIIAQQLFDYAGTVGLLNPDDRRGSFSHMARLVGNVLVADALGLDFSKGIEELHRNRPKAEFHIVLSTVLTEAVSKALGSQAAKLKIDGFARRLNAMTGVTSVRIDAVPIVDNVLSKSTGGQGAGSSQPTKVSGGDVATTGNPPRPRPPLGAKYIISEPEITEALEKLGSHKLASVYYSICTLNAETHTPLIAIGAWSFFECITSSMGRNEGTAFTAFLGKGKLSQLGIGSGRELNAPTQALERVSDYGNVTKHHSVAANFDYRQIINDMKTLKPVILACLVEVK